MESHADPRDIALLERAGLSPARAYDFALAGAIIRQIKARMEGASRDEG